MLVRGVPDEREEAAKIAIASRKLATGPARTTRKRCHTGRSWNARSRSSGGDMFEVGGIARRAHVANELDIAAKREPTDLPARALPVGPADDLATEADREDLRRDPEQRARDSGQARGRRRAGPARRRTRSGSAKEAVAASISGTVAFIADSTRCAYARSISSTSPIDRGAAKSASLKRIFDHARNIGKPSRPSRKLATATSLAAFRTIGAAPPFSSASRASRSAGTVRHRALSKSSRAIAARSSRCAGVSQPFRPGERIGNRDSHVGAAELREHRAVDDIPPWNE